MEHTTDTIYVNEHLLNTPSDLLNCPLTHCGSKLLFVARVSRASKFFGVFFGAFFPVRKSKHFSHLKRLEVIGSSHSRDRVY